MTIEWFPGHMATARRDVAETMRRTDVVIEVLDARVPGASKSPLVEELRSQTPRPALKLLNKADVADPALTRLWLDHYNAQPKTRAIALTANKGSEVARIVKACLALAPGRGTPQEQLRLMILGIPNVGKSTLMNTLLHRNVANVGDEPAITKVQTRHTINPGVIIIDTPGMLWPKLDQAVAVKLAISHSIGRNAYDEIEVALDLGRRLLQDYPTLLAKRFGAFPAATVRDSSVRLFDNMALLEHIAKARSITAPDIIAKAAAVLLNDFRSGRIGRITLETPPARAVAMATSTDPGADTAPTT
jgi:ribosome biogenesis GTPase A